jgi:hypothetical protein
MRSSVERSAVAGLVVFGMLCAGAWIRAWRPHESTADPQVETSSGLASEKSLPAVAQLAAASASASTSSTLAFHDASGESEGEMMSRLRAADPGVTVRLAREISRKYPVGPLADERDARVVDALLALGQLREAHYRAQLFVQHHPDSPFAPHVMNLMGVHPRPPGVVPEPADDDKEP